MIAPASPLDGDVTHLAAVIVAPANGPAISQAHARVAATTSSNRNSTVQLGAPGQGADVEYLSKGVDLVVGGSVTQHTGLLRSVGVEESGEHCERVISCGRCNSQRAQSLPNKSTTQGAPGWRRGLPPVQLERLRDRGCMRVARPASGMHLARVAGACTSGVLCELTFFPPQRTPPSDARITQPCLAPRASATPAAATPLRVALQATMVQTPGAPAGRETLANRTLVAGMPQATLERLEQVGPPARPGA